MFVKKILSYHLYIYKVYLSFLVIILGLSLHITLIYHIVSLTIKNIFINSLILQLINWPQKHEVSHIKNLNYT